MTCPKCGKPYSEGENFCSNCGWALKPSLSGYRHASLITRFLAYLIDALLILVPLVLIMFYHIYGKYGEQLLEPTLYYDIIMKELLLFTIVPILVLFLYFSLLEGRFQATIGKKLLRIRIVNKDFAPIGYSKAVMRNALRLIWQLPIGFLILILDVFLILTRHQRLGDIAAKTYVMST